MGAGPILGAVTPRSRWGGSPPSGIDESPDPQDSRTLRNFRIGEEKMQNVPAGQMEEAKSLKTSEREPVQSVARQTNSKCLVNFNC